MIGLFSSMSRMLNGPIKSEHLPSEKLSFNVDTSVEGLSAVIISKVGSSSIDEKVSLPSSGRSSSSISVVSASGVYASPSDLIILPSSEGLAPNVAGTINCEVGTHQSIVDTTADIIVSHDINGSEFSFLQETVASEKSHTFINGKVKENLNEIEGGNVLNTSQTASPASSITSASGSRPSSNYSNRSQHPGAPIKGIFLFGNS